MEQVFTQLLEIFPWLINVATFIGTAWVLLPVIAELGLKIAKLTKTEKDDKFFQAVFKFSDKFGPSLDFFTRYSKIDFKDKKNDK